MGNVELLGLPVTVAGAPEFGVLVLVPNPKSKVPLGLMAVTTSAFAVP
jgi:hypothetical protein